MRPSNEYFTIHIDGQELQVPRFCPHRAGRLDHGYVNKKRRTISCPLHRSVFSLDSGQQLAGPKCGDITVSLKMSAIADITDPSINNQQ